MGDESSEPGELPEDTLMWVESSKPKLLCHLLAHQIASHHSIDPTDGVEPVQSLQSAACFKGKNFLEEKKKALEEARRYRAGNVLWADGSKLSQGNFGAAVCWKDKHLDTSSIFLG